MIDDRGQRRLLVRHFFGGFLENDLISPGSDLHGVLAKFAAILILPAGFYPFALLFKYGYPFRTYRDLEIASWSDKSLFVTLSMVVMGLVTVLEWDALQLGRRDGMVFGVLPVRGRTIIEAKLLALGRFVLLVSGGLTLIGALTFPFVMHARYSASLAAIGATILGHAVACGGAAAFAFFSLLALRGLLQLVLGSAAFRRAASAVQLVATFALAVSLLMLPAIASNTAALKKSTSAVAAMAPEMWFLGLYEMISGHGDADWHRLANRGIVALIASSVVGLAATLLAYQRVLSRAAEAEQAGRPGRSWATRAFDCVGWILLRDSVERGFFSFTVATLFRSAWQRMVLAGFLGAALALSLAALDLSTYDRWGVTRVPVTEPHLLFVELLIISITLAGVRAAAGSPAELKASWVLRLLDAGESARWLAGFRKAVMVAVVAPLVAAMAALVWFQFGWDMAWPHAVAQFCFAVIMVEVLFLGFGKVPFACAFEGATGTVRVRWLLLIAFLTMTLFHLGRLIAFARTSLAGAISLLLFAGLAFGVLRLISNRGLSRGGGLRFEAEDDSTQALGLSS